MSNFGTIFLVIPNMPSKNYPAYALVKGHPPPVLLILSAGPFFSPKRAVGTIPGAFLE